MQNKYIISLIVISVAIVLTGLILLMPKESDGEVILNSSDTTSTSAVTVTNTSENTNMAVKVFFGNTNNNPNIMDCSLVYPVSRIVTSTMAVGTIAINQLLTGITASEELGGYYTAINPGVKLNSLQIKNNIAYANFDEKLEQAVGGSCRVTTIISQITNTLKQFPTVSEVVISINGRTEPILQP